MFAAPSGEIDLLRRAVTSVGWTSWSREQGFIALSPRDHGARRAILVEKAQPARAGLLGVVFSLNRPEHHTEQLGDAILKVGILGQPYAVLWFGAPSLQTETELAAALAQ